MKPYWIEIGSLVKWERSFDPQSIGGYFKEQSEDKKTETKKNSNNQTIHQVPLVISLKLTPVSENLSADQGNASILLQLCDAINAVGLA